MTIDDIDAGMHCPIGKMIPNPRERTFAVPVPTAPTHVRERIKCLHENC